jgi:hypothetical protein
MNAVDQGLAHVIGSRPSAADSQVEVAPRITRSTALAITGGLFGLALMMRLWAVASISFPLTEGSAYYVAVARNLVTGRGLEIDAIWSYATPPLTLPRPAFELWQPLASFVAAVPMTMLGPTFSTAQLGFAVLGALLAPLTWLVARDVARRLELPSRRAWSMSIGAGLLAGLSGPLLLSSALPDSALPFTILTVVACLVMPSAAAGRQTGVVVLGAVLGWAYLTRMEAVYLGLAFLIVATLTAIDLTPTARIRRTALLALGVGAVGALVALPWWLRNLAVFGSPTPGQVVDNLLLVRNEQIFAYAHRPTLEAFVAQGAPELLAKAAAAAGHNLVNVLVVPVGPLAVAGLLTIVVGLWRLHRASRADVARGPLGALLIFGAIAFAATTLLFPVATLWGTFEHAAGPLVIGLIVAAAVGADALVARVRSWRNWPRSNAWLAPAALMLVTLPLTALQVSAADMQASNRERLITQIAASVPVALETAGVDPRAPLIGDRPVWLSGAMDRPVIVLPDEPAADVLRLATDFGAQAVIISEPRGIHPAALRSDGAGAACFVELTAADLPAGTAVFRLVDGCR